LIGAKQVYIDTYKPLVIEFLNKIKGTGHENMPQPFLPLYGQLYDSTPVRIAFVGMETRGWGNMGEFVKRVDDDTEEAILREFEEFDELDFRFWGNNFGRTFWDFNFKFLAAFHGVDDWKVVKRGGRDDILKSFAWGNTNAIERHHVTAAKNGVDVESWAVVKRASKIFDKSSLIINVMQPHLIVILNWETPEEWLTGEFDNVVKEKIDDHLSYYYVGKTQTHILWTAHPTWLAKNRDFDEYIKYMVRFIKQKITNESISD